MSTNHALNQNAGIPLIDLLDDWRVHLRAKGRRPLTIDSYLAAGRTLCTYLEANGMPADAAAVTREHLEHFLGDEHERVSATTVAKDLSCTGLVPWRVDWG
ncbi:MAG TPA: hypothetical protein VK053_01775 [Jiangellaceae bacterium]|nr:hypothetical protein [Jiangellaceae bacterium]